MRNIVICCDGTGNEISENTSNVLKLYRYCARPRRKSRASMSVATLARSDLGRELRYDSTPSLSRLHLLTPAAAAPPSAVRIPAARS